MTNEWKLSRYAKSKMNSNSTSNEEWEFYNNDKKEMKLTLLDTCHFMITLGTDVLVNMSLHDAKSWMKGYYKGDSFLFLCRVSKNAVRKFRIQFARDRDQSSIQMCSRCSVELSKYFQVKGPNETPTKKSGDPITFSGAIPIGQVAEVLTGQLKANLPSAYQHTNLPTSELSTIVRLCLTDSNFPAFVGQVEKELEMITKNCS